MGFYHFYFGFGSLIPTLLILDCSSKQQLLKALATECDRNENTKQKSKRLKQNNEQAVNQSKIKKIYSTK